MIGAVIVNEGKVVRPSQLIASVGRTRRSERKRRSTGLAAELHDNG
jgi:hypothetical protein